MPLLGMAQGFVLVGMVNILPPGFFRALQQFAPTFWDEELVATGVEQRV
jgi:hypothetical protein